MNAYRFLLRTILIIWLASSSLMGSAQLQNRMRISLITCGTGEQVWELFGHTAIRIIDSARGTDLVYNYGMFNGFEEGFELKFMRGKLDYFVAAYPYAYFLPEYVESGRRVEEQVLNLDSSERQRLYELLEENLLEVNKYYKYDFFYDNCATRIRDIFPRVAQGSFKYGQTLAGQRRMTYRQIMNEYLYADHFTRFGINLLLGMPTDRVMTNEGIMFLPDFLREGLAGATIAGRKVASPAVTLLPGNAPRPAGINWMFWINLGLLTILIAGVLQGRGFGDLMSRFFLFLTGFVGCFILVMWLATDHQACQRNLNLLWALPTNLFVAFTPFNKRSRYAIIGIVGIFAALLLHLLHVQELPLFEGVPLFAGLLLVYGMIYRRVKH